jgi:transketolase
MGNNSSQRLAYGEALVELGAANPNVVVLEADLGKSTMSAMFEKAYPERYFEMGIAEQNMLSTAAGLAASGKIPFCSTFAVFASGRPYDQIRQTIAIGKLNVKICGSSSGLSDFSDGATHQAVEDIAIMSALPNMTVLTPCDATQTKLAVRAAAQINGPVYLRVVRSELPDLTDPSDEFEVGKLQVLKPGTDVLLLAHGAMVSAALEAAAQLQEQGTSAMVVNVATMKPFDYGGVAAIAEQLKAVVTCEDHSYLGGLAAATALALRRSKIPMDYVAIDDTFGQSAHNIAELMAHYGLTPAAIVGKANSLLGR